MWFTLACLVLLYIVYLIQSKQRIFNSYLHNKANMIIDRQIILEEKERLEREKESVSLLRQEIELERTRLALPLQTELDLLEKINKAKANAAIIEINRVQGLADIEIKKQKDLADVATKKATKLANIQVEKILEEKMLDFDDYKLAKCTAIQADAAALQYKIKANAEYVKQFMRQEDFNGTHDDDYTIRTPEPPYEV